LFLFFAFYDIINNDRVDKIGSDYRCLSTDLEN